MGKWDRLVPAGRLKGAGSPAIGQADDLAEADGAQILSYQQAKEKALALFKKVKKRTRLAEEGETLPEGDWTVRDVVLHYIEDARRTRKDPATAENDLKAAEANILPELQGRAEPDLKHDASTNALIRRYRSLRRA